MLTWTDISGYYLRLKEKKIKETEVNITLENGNTIHLKQTTDYPETDEIVLEVTDASAATVLNIRVPDWVKERSDSRKLYCRNRKCRRQN